MPRTRTNKNDRFKTISIALHVVSLLAILILSIVAWQQAHFISVIDNATADSDRLNAGRTGNLYGCLEKQDFECPEWKYIQKPNLD